MKKLIKTLAIASSLTCGYALAAMAQSPAEVDPQRDAYYKAFDGGKVVFISILQATELGKMWFQKMQDTLTPLGMTVDVRDSNLSTSAGAQAFTQAISEKPKVIVSWNPDLTAYARLIQQAQKQGIYVVSINMGSKAIADAYVGPDWVTIGKMQIEGAINACKGKSNNIAIIQGNVNSGQNVLEMAGINEVLAQNPDVTIVANQQADWDPNKAKAIVSTIVKQYPDICAVLGSTDSMDFGIAAAVQEAGLADQVYVSTSGTGKKDFACDQINNGTFDQYISYNLPQQSLQLTTMIQTLISSEVAPGSNKMVAYTPLTEISRDNVGTKDICWEGAK